MEILLVEIPSTILEELVRSKCIAKESFIVVEAYQKGYKQSPEYTQLVVKLKEIERQKEPIFKKLEQLKNEYEKRANQETPTGG